MTRGRLAQVQALGRTDNASFVQDGFKDQQKVEIEGSKIHRFSWGQYSSRAWAEQINAFAQL
jgi:hypothetical protein